MPDRNESEAMCEDTHRPFSLSPRQTQVLELAAEGLTADGMARRLFVTERTIRKHLKDARYILNAFNTTQAVAIAVATDLIQVPNLDELIKMKPVDHLYY